MKSTLKNRAFAIYLLAQVLGVVLLVTCSLSASASGETNSVIQYGSRTWQMDEGLPQNAILTLAQTSEGYIWVGTTKGLTRFDGARFTVFDLQNTPELKNSAVTALRVARDGTLWIGTAGGGVTRLKDGRFANFQLSTEQQGNAVKCIVESRDGSLWIGTVAGLVHWVDGKITRYTTKEGLPNDVVRAVCEVPDGIYVATDAGLCVLRNGVLTDQSEFGDLPLRSVLRDNRGNLWVGWVGGLMCLLPDGQLLYYTKADGLADNNVCMLHEDRRGELWLGTYGGLNRLAGGKFIIEKDNFGIFYDQINAILEDQEGDIWVGGRDGLQQLRAKRFTSYTRQQGLAHNNVISVTEDHAGNTWIGTWGGGVSKLERGRWTNYNWENSQAKGLTTDLILSIFTDNDGSILIGADYEGGTFRFQEGKFTRVWSVEQSLIDRVIRVIYRDREGNLWFGASPGLISLNTQQHWLEKSVIRCITEDHKGVLWVGTQNGLYCRQNGKFVKWPASGTNLDFTIIALHEDAEQNLWIGGVNHGLVRVRNGQLTTYTSTQGLVSDDIFEILDDDQGWLWMSSPKGVFRVSKKNLDDLDAHKTETISCIAYGKSDGMQSVQCNGVAKPAAWKGHDGRMWFATTKGLVVTDPKLNRNINEKPPTVLIEEVIADKQSVRSGMTGPASAGDVKLTVQAGSRDLEIHYTALSFQEPEKNRFKYKLDGVDRDWVEVTRRVAYYNNLRPGNYKFHVMACNNDGVWNTAGATMAVRLQPYFWQTWSFVVFAALLLGATAVGVARSVTQRNMGRELQRLEQQRAVEQERIRIARDMHDEIGAKLTKISFLGAAVRRRLAQPEVEETGQQIDKMSQTARDVIRALDEIVWAVNPANDSLEDLATYLCRNATEFFADSPIACQFSIPPELPVCRIGTHVRHNILLASKEALNNVLKHSGATHVRVQIADSEGLFEVMISDNGRGFDADANKSAVNGHTPDLPRVGNGLANMRSRLEAIGGECRVNSNVGQGTSIAFTVWLNGKNGA